MILYVSPASSISLLLPATPSVRRCSRDRSPFPLLSLPRSCTTAVFVVSAQVFLPSTSLTRGPHRRGNKDLSLVHRQGRWKKRGRWKRDWGSRKEVEYHKLLEVKHVTSKKFSALWKIFAVQKSIPRAKEKLNFVRFCRVRLSNMYSWSNPHCSRSSSTLSS